MGRQLRIMQAPQDVAELWNAIPSRYNASAIPRKMDRLPVVACNPSQVASSQLLLFCATEWQELRSYITERFEGVYFLSPRVGVVEWDQTEVQNDSHYIVGSRLYFQNADVLWSGSSSRLFGWMLRWIKVNYYLAPAKQAPIAIGRHLLADIGSGKARATYPNGKEVVCGQFLGGKV